MLFRVLALVATFTVSFCAATSAPLVYSAALQNEEGPLDVAPHRRLGNGHDKSRSPCPFLNTAANHGILPYDGKNIRVEVFRRLLNKAGAPSLLTKVLGDQILKVAQLNADKDPNHPTDAIDLADLIPHGLIEHDLSMSRLDVITPQQGDNFSTSSLMDRMLKFIFKFETDAGNPAADPMSNILTTTGIGAWHNERRRIEVEERKHTPDESLKTQFLCSGECFFLLYILGRNGAISGRDAKTFLLEETFPAGWAPPTDLTNFYALRKTAECGAAFKANTKVLSWFDKPSWFSSQHSSFTNSFGSSQ